MTCGKAWEIMQPGILIRTSRFRQVCQWDLRLSMQVPTGTEWTLNEWHAEDVGVALRYHPCICTTNMLPTPLDAKTLLPEDSPIKLLGP